MMHTAQNLYDNLGNLLLELNKQIDAVTRDTLSMWPEGENPSRDKVYSVKNTDGTYVLANLLAAKAQVLSGMAALKVSSVASNTPQRPKRTW